MVESPQFREPCGVTDFRLWSMAWTLLFFAGLFEVAWAVGLKYTDGFSKPVPSALTVAAMVASVALLGLAMKQLPVGTVILGIVLMGDSAAPMRLACLALVMLGIVGLKLTA